MSKPTYTIQVITSNVKNAGTDANIFIELFGTNGNTGKIPLKTSKLNKDPFEQGKTDLFEINCANVGSLRKINIGHDNKGMASGWHLKEVTIKSEADGRQWLCECNQWFAKDEADKRIERELVAVEQHTTINQPPQPKPQPQPQPQPTPIPSNPHYPEKTYLIKTVTSNIKYAGTDANVFIDLIGTNGNTGKILLKNSKTNRDPFEQGKIDEFDIRARDVGSLRKINIGHDAKGTSNGWHLKEVHIETPADGHKWLCVCNQWFAKDEGDKRIERELLASDISSSHTNNNNNNNNYHYAPDNYIDDIHHEIPSNTIFNDYTTTRSSLQEQIMNASGAPIPIRENTTCTVRVNGQDITGIWVNREECMNWRGPIPLDRYKINSDAETQFIKKFTTQTHEATQNIVIKYLKPTTQAQVGDLIIRHEPDVQIPPAPPIIVRQQAVGVTKMPPMVYRERPPRTPPSIPQEVITLPGRTIEPPPRQVIVERMPQAAALPGDIVIERWLAHGRQRRRVVHEKHVQRAQSSVAPRNVLIDWESQDRTQIRQKLNFLGVEQCDPVMYERSHGHELVESTRLPAFANEINVTSHIPNGEILADKQHLQSREYILVGDVEALNLVEEDLTKYLISRF